MSWWGDYKRLSGFPIGLGAKRKPSKLTPKKKICADVKEDYLTPAGAILHSQWTCLTAYVFFLAFNLAWQGNLLWCKLLRQRSPMNPRSRCRVLLFQALPQPTRQALFPHFNVLVVWTRFHFSPFPAMFNWFLKESRRCFSSIMSQCNATQRRIFECFHLNLENLFIRGPNATA